MHAACGWAGYYYYKTEQNLRLEMQFCKNSFVKHFLVLTKHLAVLINNKEVHT